MDLFLLTPIGVSRGIFTHYICNAFVFLGDVGIGLSKSDGGKIMRMEKFSDGDGNMFLVDL